MGSNWLYLYWNLKAEQNNANKSIAINSVQFSRANQENQPQKSLKGLCVRLGINLVDGFGRTAVFPLPLVSMVQ